MDDIDSLFEDIEDTIQAIVYTEIPKKINEIYQKEAIDSYTQYSPSSENVSRYRRGESGSFADDVNYRTEIEKSGNVIDITMYNDRITDCGCDYCVSEDRYLDYYVEEGIAGISNITKKPVAQNTQEKIDDELADIIESSLISKGYDIK